MKTCILKPNTKRLKQLIKEQGNVWIVVKTEREVQCFKDSPTGVFITSNTGSHSRWVRPTDIEIV